MNKNAFEQATKAKNMNIESQILDQVEAIKVWFM